MKPNYTICLEKQIYCFDFTNTTNLFCAAVQNKIVLGVLKFSESSENNELVWEKVRELNHDIRCHAISFAPDLSSDLPKKVKFCTADSDFVIRIYRTNLEDSDTIQEVCGHTSYVNDLVWEPICGKYLASASDDHSCQVYSQNDDYRSRIKFFLKSAAMGVQFHKNQMDKLLVAEKRGTIHVCNIERKQILLSIETSIAPLLCADWCLRNHLTIISLPAGEITIFDLRFPFRNIESKIIHDDGGLAVKYAQRSEHLASIGRPGVTLKVKSSSNSPHTMAKLKLFGGLSWFSRYVCASDDTKLCFWKVY